jgi:hypothetical protein
MKIELSIKTAVKTSNPVRIYIGLETQCEGKNTENFETKQ